MNRISLKRVARIISGQSPSSSDVLLLDEGTPFLQGNAEFGAEYPLAKYECDAAPKHSEIGDILLSVRAPVGALNISNRRYAIGRGLCSIKATSMDQRYLWWWMHSQVEMLNAIATGSTYTAVTAEQVGSCQVPDIGIDEQRHIADFLDAEVARIEKVSSGYLRMKSLIAERTKSLVDGLVGADGLAVPLRYAVRFREGPGIMADDFRDKGIPLIRISGLHDGEVTLRGCNYLDEKKVIEKWKQFRLQRGDYIISGSATMGGVSVVLDDSVVGAIPYTGLIILRPATAGVEMNYISAVLASSYFMRQIDVLKTGSTMQHFGPTHLSQVRIPLPSPYKQRLIASEVKVVQRQEIRAKELVDHQLELMEERKRALITAAVTGQIDVTTARGADLS